MKKNVYNMGFLFIRWQYFVEKRCDGHNQTLFNVYKVAQNKTWLYSEL